MQTTPKTASLFDSHGVERLRYDYASAPKPFLHPLCLPDGTVLTAHEPADHSWHRGLWFAFKFVNGINYWEERDAIFGYQVSEATHVRTSESGVLEIEQTLSWQDARDELLATVPQCHERRKLTASLDATDALILDWQMALTTTQQELVLDRTPFTTWGGYGGLFVRLRNDLTNAQIVFDDGTTTTRPLGEAHRWGGIEGTTPGGKDCALVFLPKATNPRYPEPFYGAAKPDYHFFGPAPLFHAPLHLTRGATLDYGVRVLVLPRRIDPAEIERYNTGTHGESDT